MTVTAELLPRDLAYASFVNTIGFLTKGAGVNNLQRRLAVEAYPRVANLLKEGRENEARSLLLAAVERTHGVKLPTRPDGKGGFYLEMAHEPA